MASIGIKDLHIDQSLKQQAMARIRGASGAPWVFGWIQAYMPAQPGNTPVINFYQINNYADQLINQFQMVNVSNTAPDANLTVNTGARSGNDGII
jgi:hypothetical protein